MKNGPFYAVIRTAAVYIGGYDDSVRLEELRLSLESIRAGFMKLESTDYHQLLYVAASFEDRANPNEGFDHTAAERRSCAVAAKAIRAQVGEQLLNLWNTHGGPETYISLGASEDGGRWTIVSKGTPLSAGKLFRGDLAPVAAQYRIRLKSLPVWDGNVGRFTEAPKA